MTFSAIAAGDERPPQTQTSTMTRVLLISTHLPSVNMIIQAALIKFRQSKFLRRFMSPTTRLMAPTTPSDWTMEAQKRSSGSFKRLVIHAD